VRPTIKAAISASAGPRVRHRGARSRPAPATATWTTIFRFEGFSEVAPSEAFHRRISHQTRLVGPWSPNHPLSIFVLFEVPPDGSPRVRPVSPFMAAFAGRFRRPKSRPQHRFHRRLSWGARRCPHWHLSIWKNEGKNSFPRPVKGGFEGPDALYDSQPELTGFPTCLTLKTRSPESRRRRRIFAPYPSSTR
jgi:hypothetical protein